MIETGLMNPKKYLVSSGLKKVVDKSKEMFGILLVVIMKLVVQIMKLCSCILAPKCHNFRGIINSLYCLIT